MASLSQSVDSAVQRLMEWEASGRDWRSLLRPASFRGKPFDVIDGSLSGGQRYAAHEYPGLDAGYCEPLGAATESYSYTAFVHGVDWWVARDNLIAALREPGPGALVDPWHGMVEVVAVTWEKSDIYIQGYYTAFTLTFIPAGSPLTIEAIDYETPESLLSMAEDLLAAASSALAAAIDLAGAPARLVTSAVQRLRQAGEIAVARVRSASASTARAWEELVDTFDMAEGSGGMAAFAAEVLTDLQNVLTALPGPDALALADGYADAPAAQDAADALPVVPYWPRIEARNAAAIDTYLLQTYLAASLQAAATDTVADYDTAIARRDILVRLLTAAGLAAYADAAYAVLSSRAEGLDRLVQYEVPQSVPASVLAYRLYGDLDRADELCDRNGVEHPGFVRGTLRIVEP